MINEDRNAYALFYIQLSYNQWLGIAIYERIVTNSYDLEVWKLSASTNHLCYFDAIFLQIIHLKAMMIMMRMTKLASRIL